MTPDRTRPASVAFVARNHMEMKLTHNIAQSAHIDLVAIGRFLERLRNDPRLEGQHGLVERRHIVNFDQPHAARHEDQPGPAAVIYQPQFAQTELGDRKTVGIKSFIEFKLFHGIILTSFFRYVLAFYAMIDDMQRGRLVVDEPLANRVRSGRKQP